MSYQSQAQLAGDPLFQGRSTSCAMQQADTYINDQRPNFVAVAEAVLRDESTVTLTFTRLNAAAPGAAEKVDNGDGTISQENVSDGDLLAATQANWQVVAGLYFNEDGTPKT